MSVAKLPLQEQEVSATSRIRQITVGVTQQLHAGPIFQTGGSQDSDYAAIESRTLIGGLSLAEKERLLEIIGGYVWGQEGGARAGRELSHEVAYALRDVDRAPAALRAPNDEDRATCSEYGVGHAQATEFRVAQSGEEKTLNNESVKLCRRCLAPRCLMRSRTDVPEQVLDLFEKPMETHKAVVQPATIIELRMGIQKSRSSNRAR
jgi:hypothetical protein